MKNLEDNRKDYIKTIYNNMKYRCYNKKCPDYSRYGGRNIKICEEWLNQENGFENFYKWCIQNNYLDNYSLDRIDNNGNYSPSNCQFVPKHFNTAKIHRDKKIAKLELQLKDTKDAETALKLKKEIFELKKANIFQINNDYIEDKIKQCENDIKCLEFRIALNQRQIEKYNSEIKSLQLQIDKLKRRTF